MDFNLESLKHYVIGPITHQVAEFVELPKQTNHYLLMAATIGLGRNSGLFHQTKDSFGLFHIKEEQHTTIWDDHLVKNPNLASSVRGLASQHQFLKTPHTELCTNLNYATAIAAIALTLKPMSYHSDVSLHQQIALLNAAFPGFKYITRQEWQEATDILNAEVRKPIILGPSVSDDSEAICA